MGCAFAAQADSTNRLAPLKASGGFNTRELFYLGPNSALMSVKVESKGAWSAAAPVKLMEGRRYSGSGPGGGTGRTYDVSVDSRRFLVIKQSEAGTTVAPLVVVQNWFEELNKLVPGK